jgi:hypothetical protein
MSEFVSPSSLDPGSQFTAGSQFDVATVDTNVRTISAIESTWKLPRLPDVVKLDLASVTGMQPSGIQEFLLGLETDLTEEPEPEVDPAEGLRTQFLEENGVTDGDRLSTVVAGVIGNRPPTEVSVDSVKRFKLDAIRRGYLQPPESGQLDSNWSPELNSLRREMLFDDINSMNRGDRPGAIPADTVFDAIGRWTSPGALLSAATDLDLWWDAGAISDEWTTWGDKWRKVADSNDPFDFAKNLIDAATGPVDDIVFPVINWALIGMGVGVAFNSARIGVLGARAVSSSKWIRGIYSIARPQTVNELVQASWTARKLQGSSSTVLSAAGDALAAWRSFTPVARTKQVVQSGMRLGIASQAQDAFPGYQGGSSLADAVPALGAGADALEQFSLRSPLSIVPELAFAPLNVMNPGTYFRSGGEGVNVVSNALRGAVRSVGTPLGRAGIGGVVGAGVGTFSGDDAGDVLQGATFGAIAGAAIPLIGRNALGRAGVGSLIGAGVAYSTDAEIENGIMFGAATGAAMLPVGSYWSKVPFAGKAVGFVTDAAKILDFKPLAQDQQVSAVFQSGMRRYLRDLDDGDALKAWDDDVTQNGFVKAMSNYWGSTEDSTASGMAFVLVAAAIDHTAAVQSGGYENIDMFHLFLDKLISQLRTFDIDDPGSFTREQVARAVAWGRATNPDSVRRQFDKVMETLDDATALKLADEHNTRAKRLLEQLTSTENLPDLDPVSSAWATASSEEKMGILEAYIPKAMGTFGNWAEFTGNSHQSKQWVESGILDGASFLGVQTPYGTVRNVKKDLYKLNPRVQQASDEVQDTLLRDPVAAERTASMLNPLANQQATGRFTIMRNDTLTKQFFEEEGYRLQDLVDTVEKLRHLDRKGVLGRVRSELSAGGRELADLDRDEVDAVAALVGSPGSKGMLRHLNSYMKRHGLTLDDLDAALNDLVTRLATDEQHWSKFGLVPHLVDDAGVPLEGVAALKRRIKQVRKAARFKAAEIDIDATARSVRETQGDDVADQFLAEVQVMREDGYKLVHGVEFMMPYDLMHYTPAFADLGRREANFQTLGNFFGPKQPPLARAIQERRERTAIVKAFSDAGMFEGRSVDDELVSNVLSDLHKILREKQDVVGNQADQYHLLSFWEKRRLALDSSFAPLRVEDLQRHSTFVVDRLKKMGWSDEEAGTIMSAVPYFRNTEFRDLGLYAIEAKIRRANLAEGTLKVLTANSSLFSPRTAGIAVGAYTGAAQADSDVDSTEAESLGERLVGAGVGALVGGLGGEAVVRSARSASSKYDLASKAKNQFRWQLGDKYVRLRDSLRFALSPVFEVSRYTEGLMLGQVGVPLRRADGSQIVLPLNMSPTGVRNRIGRQAFDTDRAEFNSLSRSFGHGDVDVADDALKRFEQIGIFGFNPQQWQAAAYSELKRAGLSAEQAYDGARATYTYGAHGRSAAELSVNFLFFPFSFQKKSLTHIAEWMSDDLGRSIIIHDALKTYETLNEKYNLSEFWREHVPGLTMLNRLNLFAYGISPGRFGGINAELVRAVDHTVGAFLPIGLNLTGEEDYNTLERLKKSLLPMINDINWMSETARDTINVATTPGHKTRRGQIMSGYDEWNAYRSELQAELEAAGAKWSDLYNHPRFEKMYLAYEVKRAELAMKYPEWSKSRQESIFNVQALEMERNDLDALAQQQRQTFGVYDPSTSAGLLGAYEDELAGVKERLRLEGVSVDGPDGWADAPPWASDYLKEIAVRMLEQYPKFESVYRKFYERELGPIRSTVV